MTDSIDIAIRAADERALIAALPFARGVDEDGNQIWIQYTHDYLLDFFKVEETRAVTDQDGNVITPATFEPGVQGNLRIHRNYARYIAQLREFDGEGRETTPLLTVDAMIKRTAVRTAPLKPWHRQWA